MVSDTQNTEASGINGNGGGDANNGDTRETIITKVAITKGDCYSGSWIIKNLLEKETYDIWAYVKDKKRCDYLENLDGAKDRLTLLDESDVSNEDILDGDEFSNFLKKLMKNCHGVFVTDIPTSIPNNMTTKETQKYITTNAPKHINSVMMAAVFENVEKVVLTSSESTIRHCNRAFTNVCDPFEEKNESDEKYMGKNKYWNALWMTIAEKKAVECAKKNNGLKLVTIHIGAVIGPVLHKTLDASLTGVFEILELIKGREGVKNVVQGWTNVKDVARGHILAFENKLAEGKYIMVERVAHFCEVAQILNTIHPRLLISKNCETKNLEDVYGLSIQRSRGLGMRYTSLRDTLTELCNSIDDIGLYPIKMVTDYSKLIGYVRQMDKILSGCPRIGEKINATLDHLNQGTSDLKDTIDSIRMDLQERSAIGTSKWDNQLIKDEDEVLNNQPLMTSEEGLDRILEGLIVRYNGKVGQSRTNGLGCNQQIAEKFLKLFSVNERHLKAIMTHIKAIKDIRNKKNKKSNPDFLEENSEDEII